MPICEICGEEFQYKNYVKSKYCSRSCAAKSRHQVKKLKVCSFPGCDNTFMGSATEKYCKDIHYVICPVCGKQTPARNNSTESVCCSVECRKQKETDTKRDKYAVPPSMTEQAKEKRLATMQSRYGVDYAMQNGEIQAKAKKTNLYRYGVPYIPQWSEFQAKSESTSLQRYGVSNPSQSTSAIEKRHNTVVDRYGTDNVMKNALISSKAMRNRKEKHHSYFNKSSRMSLIETNVERYNVLYCGMNDEDINNVDSTFRLSKINKRFSELLSSNGISHSIEFHIEENKQYDIKLTDSNIVIEIDPSYTHNSFGNHWNTSGLDTYYHRNKSRLAEDNGYRCIHVFDWEDWDKLVYLMQDKMNIYARQCEVIQLSLDEVSPFLNKYHLQSSCDGQICNYGLTYMDRLIQVMTFGKPRHDKQYEWELLRLCTYPKAKVVGGAERLFKHFVRDHDPSSIVSYCDRSKFNGDVYTRLGFNSLEPTEPQKIWSRGTDKIPSDLLSKKGYDQLFGTSYGDEISNDQLMLENGWLPVYNCGYGVYSYTK